MTTDEIMELADDWRISGSIEHWEALRAAVEQLVRERDAHARASASNYAAFQIAANARDRAEQERESFYIDYRMKCDEETKALHVKLERAEQERSRAISELLTMTNRAERAEAEAAALRELLKEARQDVERADSSWHYKQDFLARIDAALKP